MSPATSTMPCTDDAEIPILDLAPYLSEQLGARKKLGTQLCDALENIGFYFIKSRGISQSLVDAICRARWGCRSRENSITPRPQPGGSAYVTRIMVPLVMIVAIAMRAYGLNGQFDYDGYDEGVYWQTLRAMRAGYSLYGGIFCSQPPAFMLSIYPIYILFGSTIVAARIGVAVLSLLGLAGAYLLGKTLAGRAAGIAALATVVTTPSYLQASRTLQAEGPAVAFLFLTIATAFMWWEHPNGRKGILLAVLSSVMLLLGTLVKLLDITAVVPVLVIAFGRLWQMLRTEGSRIEMVLRPMVVAGVASAFLLLIVLAAFAGSLSALVRQVLTFHIAARGTTIVSPFDNFHLLVQFLTANVALSTGAAIGVVVSIFRHDWRIVPLICWIATTFAGLILQAPLFLHHAVVLIPPLLAISVLALDDFPSRYYIRLVSRMPMRSHVSVLILIVVGAVLTGVLSDYAEGGDGQRATEIIADVQRTTTPDQWVITDAQFILGLANRNTPPWLTDTSSVRISSEYLTMPELTEAASDARVHAILFVTSRLYSESFAGFHSWVARHYRLSRMYGVGVELWTR
jgi:hypothetical protein